MSNMFSDHKISVGPPNGATEVRLDFKTGPQTLPDPSLGGDGQTNFGVSVDRTQPPDQAKTPEGNFDISLDAVAPVKYPWPKDTIRVGITDATGARSGAGG